MESFASPKAQPEGLLRLTKLEGTEITGKHDRQTLFYF